MPRNRAAEELSELAQWLSASIAEADRLLPDLLDKPAAVLRRELGARPELRTAGMVRRLTTVAHEALERYPRWARELTSIVVEIAPSIAVPASHVPIVRRLHAQAWIEHGQALLGIGEIVEARAAIDAARGLLESTPVNQWYLATADVVEARILHGLGQRENALRLVRGAAACFALHADYERYFQAQMTEAWMHWNAGEPASAAAVWRATAEIAQQRGDRTLMARLKRYLGIFELEHGSADEAGRLLAEAVALFDAAGWKKEAVGARWNLAEAAAARGRIHEAISEYYKVRAELLAARAVIDAAIVSTEILDLMIVAGRERETASLAEMLLRTFCETGMSQVAVQAWAYVRARAEAGKLTREDVASVRRYFEDLAVQPKAPFLAPENR